MSYTNTTRLGLAKADPGTNQAFQTTVFNLNLDKIDAEAVAVDARLDTVEANDWVTSARIAPNAVGASEIQSGAVSSDELASNAVTTVKITDLNVTADKLANTLDLTGKTVSVAAPSSGAHATTKTYVDAGDAATLVSAKAYTDAIAGDVVVLASGSWSVGAGAFGTSINTSAYRKLVLSITTTVYTGMTGMSVAFTGATSWDTVTTTFGSTSLTTAAGTSLQADALSSGIVNVFEIDYPGAAVKKNLFVRGNSKFIHGRSTNAAAITAFLCSPFGTGTASGTYEVIGYK
jgi:hypothetical protein